MTTTAFRRARATLTAALLAPVLLFGVAACSPQQEDPASAPETGTSDTPFFDWQLAFAECMRDEGVDVPDPENSSMGGMAVDSSIDMAAFQAAAEVCRTELGEPPAPSESERSDMEQDALVWLREAAECYRENGYDMADPKLGESPDFPTDAPQEIVEECGGAAGATTPLSE